MSALLAATAAAVGVYLMLPATRRGGPSLRDRGRALAADARIHMDRAGLEAVTPTQFVVVSVAAGCAAAFLTAAMFGVGLPAFGVGLVACCAPTVVGRRRRAARVRAARSAWPRMVEELRVLVGAAGRSIPQALIDVGLAGPEELRPAFRAAQREWALSADFERVGSILKRHLNDPTADMVIETLLVANDVGGDVDQRLQALAEDRRRDLQGRREATAKQAGARLARWFVIVVPGGMAVAGLSVGEGRAAYASGRGQMLVCAGLALMAMCWVWASRIMVLPEQRRVFDR